MFSEKRIIGYWKEEKHYFENQNIRISLIELKNKKAEYPKEKVIDYLKNGHYISGHRGYTKDLFDESKKTAGGKSEITDGMWVWTQDVIYYIENYNIGLPDEFLIHMEKNNYKVPKITEQIIYEIGEGLSEITRLP